MAERASQRECAVCEEKKNIDLFSKKQWLAKAHSRKCKTCIDAADGTTPPAAAEVGKEQKEDFKVKGKGAGGTGRKNNNIRDSKKSKDPVSTVVDHMDDAARKRLETMMSGAAAEQEEEDPFVCDVTGALISMINDGRYHFNDGRPPDDPAAVCMSVTAHKIFDSLSKEHPDTWESDYTDKAKWEFIPAGSTF
mmetsp:Transcript_38847/g.62591  ORF Transcript_38847/g.62591 Transcript_38847/m.62591 type:complete len:193 (+) Transcript_38847:3-581(+)